MCATCVVKVAPFFQLEAYYLTGVALFSTHQKHSHQEQHLSQLTLKIWDSNLVHFHAVLPVQDAAFLSHHKFLDMTCFLSQR